MVDNINFDFTLNSCGAGLVDIHNLDARYMVFYFYPKDDTSGCTIEAKEFTLLLPDFEQLSTKVFGVSKDSIESHKKFIDKYDLKVDLLSDDTGISEKLGIWVEKSMYGKKYFGIERSTFLVDKNKKILKIWRKVKPEGHAQEVLDYIKTF